MLQGVGVLSALPQQLSLPPDTPEISCNCRNEVILEGLGPPHCQGTEQVLRPRQAHCCHSDAGCSLVLTCMACGHSPGRRMKQEDTPHLAALGSWRGWVTGHVTPPSQRPDLSLN